MGFHRVLGGTASALFRFIAYVFLRWIPGRFGPYLLPLFFLLHTYTTLRVSSLVPRRPSTPAEAALVPSDPKQAPSFADVLKEGEPAHDGTSAVYERHPHVQPPPQGGSAPPTPNGSLKRKKKKGGAAGAKDPLNLLGAHSGQASASDSEPGTPTQAQQLTKRQRLPRNRPLPKATLGQLLTSLIFGTPTPTSRFLNYLALGLNAVLLFLALDYTFTPLFFQSEADLSFARIGHVSHHSAKLTARIPPSSAFSLLTHGQSTGPLVAGVVPANNSDGGFLPHDYDEFHGAKVAYRPTKPAGGRWELGPEIRTLERDDWVGTVKLEGLWAATEYEYRLLRPTLSTSPHPSFPHSQTFTTFSDPSLLSVSPGLFGSDPVAGEGTHYTFASSSCVKPGFPYEGPWAKKHTRGAREFLKVAEREAVRFMLFLGDWIYHDVPYAPKPTVENYHKQYRQVFASPEVKKMVERIPLLAINDDHELTNDFSGGGLANDSNKDALYGPAISAYNTYLGNANPDPIAGHEGENYYDFRVGDSAFFVWDTRKHRSDNHAVDDEDKVMLGERQKEAFFDWAGRVNNTVTWKFVISSVPLMSLWSHGEDTWAGFLHERDSILSVLEHIPNVIVLSGDRHEFAAASLRTTVTEFSTSPFNMFYLPIRTLSQKHGRGSTGEDQLLSYIPDGNTKFTTFEVDTRNASRPAVHVKVYVDGAVGWQVDVLGKVVHQPGTKRLLGEAEQGVGALAKGWRELLSFIRRSFF
ncbi:hypothetical protein JCM8097_000896 [Rhodosporidiobolus ruineniae]